MDNAPLVLALPHHRLPGARIAGIRPTPRSLCRAIALTGLCLAIAPAPASADSLVFIKSGSASRTAAAHPVTTDGRYATPYRSPSQADDGTIAAAYGNEIVLMRLNGTVLNRLDPPALMNSISHPTDGAPVTPRPVAAPGSQEGTEGPAWSPGGTQLAWKETNPQTGRDEGLDQAAGRHLRRRRPPPNRPIGTPGRAGHRPPPVESCLPK